MARRGRVRGRRSDCHFPSEDEYATRDVRSLIRAFLSWHRERQDEAMRLYERSGFRRIARDYPLSDDLKNWLVFFEMGL
jgi:hypothetical protein